MLCFGRSQSLRAVLEVLIFVTTALMGSMRGLEPISGLPDIPILTREATSGFVNRVRSSLYQKDGKPIPGIPMLTCGKFIITPRLKNRLPTDMGNTLPIPDVPELPAFFDGSGIIIQPHAITRKYFVIVGPYGDVSRAASKDQMAPNF